MKHERIKPVSSITWWLPRHHSLTTGVNTERFVGELTVSQRETVSHTEKETIHRPFPNEKSEKTAQSLSGGYDCKCELGNNQK